MEWEPNGISPLDWVLSLNLHRRHLNASQRACLAVDIKPQFEAEAKKRQQEADGRIGKGIASGKADNTGKASIPERKSPSGATCPRGMSPTSRRSRLTTPPCSSGSGAAIYPFRMP